MNRITRTEILIKSSSDVARRIAEEILESHQVSMINKPQDSLIMIKMRENAKRTLFYIGELIATECKVMIEQSYGIGIVQGSHPELAYHLAIIDAAYQANLPETQQWDKLLEIEKKRINQSEKMNHKRITQTKVNFETMNIEI